MRHFFIFALVVTVITACGGGSTPDQPKTDTSAAAVDAANNDLRGKSGAIVPQPGTGMPEGKKVLILHDASGPYGHVGIEYSILLANLLGHFNADVSIKPVGEYSAGAAGNYAVTFYIGSTYEERNYLSTQSAALDAYDQFIDDAGTGNYKIAWFNYNIWRLNWDYDAVHGFGAFANRFGFSFKGIENNQYNRVNYKSVELHKGVVVHPNPGANLAGCYPEGTGAYACAQEMNILTITKPELVKVWATAYSTINTEATAQPYVLEAGNLWYFADIPFTYFSEEDRYLALADLLHEIMESGVPDGVANTAMVRFEDVSPAIDPKDLDAAAKLLENYKIPFAVATVPLYVDPLDLNPDDGGNNQIRLPGSDVGKVLKKYYKKGLANIIHHGTTHQWSDTPNPYNAVTGDDFEFFRVTINPDNSLNFLGAVDDDSSSWAIDRMQMGKQLIQYTGLAPFAWEAPHYMASETDYLAINSEYPVHYGRMLYTSPAAADRFIGQFFPYVIEKDIYGYRQLPESIANIEPEPFAGYRSLFPADLIRHAQKLKVVRDGVASFFYHPYLGTQYLDDVIKGLKAEGYNFVAPCTLAQYCP